MPCQIPGWYLVGQPYAVRRPVEGPAIAVHIARCDLQNDCRPAAPANRSRGIHISAQVHVMPLLPAAMDIPGSPSVPTDRIFQLIENGVALSRK